MKRPVPDEVVLGLLKSNPSHGYDLLSCFRSRDQLGRMWTLSTSQLYAVLKRLEEEGAIKGKFVKSSDAPDRIVYSVMSKGEKQLQNWLFDPNPSASIHRIRVLFLSRVYLAQLLEIDGRPIFDYQRRACEEQRLAFLTEKERVDSTFEKLTIDFILSQLNSALTWLNRYESEFFRR